MAQLFRGRADGDSSAALDRELDSLETQIQSASPGYETQYLIRAGNLCAEADQPARALVYFGRAIDAYLESGRFQAAEVLCRKGLQIAPDAVRARCTIAGIAIGKGYLEEPIEAIADYVAAARQAGNEKLAVKQLLMMAEASTDPEVRESIAQHLLELGEEAESDRIFGAVLAERNGLRPAPERDETRIWSKLLRAALMGPEELEQQQVRGQGDGADGDLPALTGDNS
jgi:tetratricopeptide (TPR) repeat protein